MNTSFYEKIGLSDSHHRGEIDKYIISLLSHKQNISQIRTFHSAIYGDMNLGKSVVSIIDTVPIQRLRHLEQLGCASFVYPDCTHNRFSHSIGVGFLAKEYLDGLLTMQPKLNKYCTKRDYQLIQIAGICHDLGHGPFSHMFEHEFMPQVTGKPYNHTDAFRHENMSLEMFKFIVDQYDNIDLDDEEIKFVNNLITGHVPESEKDKRFWLYQIVSNKVNGADVDKFDYLSRDPFFSGFGDVLDYKRLINFSRVIDGRICFSAKEVNNVYKLFYKRYEMHKFVYSHRVVKGIALMLSKAMVLADPILNISKMINSPEDFQYLNDSIIQEISRSKADGLEESKNLIKRVYERDIYKFVGEKMIKPNSIDKIASLKLANVVEMKPINSDLTENDLRIVKTNLHFGLKNENPINNTDFYDKSDYKSMFYHLHLIIY